MSDFIGHGKSDWHEANYGQMERNGLWQCAEIEQYMKDNGFDPMQQPERKRVANWMKAARGEVVTCFAPDRFCYPLDATIAGILGRKEAKRKVKEAMLR